MNERKIQNALWHDLIKKGHGSIAPNYTPKSWWECDMFSVTKAGRFVEHEIKLSVDDFKADARKYQTRALHGPDNKILRPYQSSDVYKHSALSLGDPAGPSRFFFVVPLDMIKPDDVPVWAGLIYAYHPLSGGWNEDQKPDMHRVCFKRVKNAPKLHDSPINPNVLDHLRHIYQWRYWNLRTAIGRGNPIEQPDPIESQVD